ncbi:MAG: DUF169 domain-containing protein [Anaerolineales bacterium]|nr:DUF169 domain-containing protein [Anaerolineales bacterium]
MPEIELDIERCNGCGLCEDFCPVNVFEMIEVGGRLLPSVVRAEDCWACDTCVGQCPTGALRVVETFEYAPEPGLGGRWDGQKERAAPLSGEQQALYRSWSEKLMQVLRLRWSPVAVSLIPAGAPLPVVPMPREKLRYCQSLMAARRGKSLLMPAKCHACPDGTTILGLTEIPAKLASGELYIRFGKLDSIEAARQMIAERPRLEPRSIQATLVTPLAQATLPPDVIAVIAQPEQMMWLCMAASYYTGKRFEFKVSGYNAQCVETTLFPYTSGKINISLGCYGCRASSDVGDDLMFMGIPASEMPGLIEGLVALGKKAIPDSRDKIYLSPLT